MLSKLRRSSAQGLDFIRDRAQSLLTSRLGRRPSIDANIDPLVLIREVLAPASRASTVLSVLAPVDPIAGDERDGYVQRVKAVDLMFDVATRVYIRMREECRGAPVFRQLAEKVWALEVADNDPLGDRCLATVLGFSNAVYLHSIFGAESHSIRQAFVHYSGPKTLDVHGCVPEEYAMRGYPKRALRFGELEREVVKRSDHIICVTHAMAAHLKTKYAPITAEFIVCPIFTHHLSSVLPTARYDAEPRVVYAGGTQVWQQIPKMLDLIQETHHLYRYSILTPDVDAIETGLKERGVSTEAGRVDVRSATNEEVLHTLQASNFGLLLREANVVNRVSCPTKLIEYIGTGVIPILEGQDIGDFVQLGMRFVRLDDFRAGRIPSVVERRKMAEKNLELFDHLHDISRQGAKEISRQMRVCI
jgi:hypothetical protein